MKHRIPTLIIVVALFLISGCGGSGGGNDGPAISPNPGTASGLLNVPPGNDLELEPNDSPLQAQMVTTATTVAGRASGPDSGFQLPSGNKVQDLYRLTTNEQVRIVPTVVEDNHTANDLDCNRLPVRYLTSRVGRRPTVLYCARRATLIHIIDPYELFRFSSLGRAPMLVYVRPSNEALLRARVPGAQDQRGCPSNPFYRGGSASKKGTWPLPPHPSKAEYPLLNFSV